VKRAIEAADARVVNQDIDSSQGFDAFGRRLHGLDAVTSQGITSAFRQPLQ